MSSAGVCGVRENGRLFWCPRFDEFGGQNLVFAGDREPLFAAERPNGLPPAFSMLWSLGELAAFAAEIAQGIVLPVLS